MFFKISILIILAISSIEDIRRKEIFLWQILILGGLSLAAVVTSIYDGSFDLWNLLLSLLPGAIMIFLSFITREGVGYGDGLMALAIGPSLGAAASVMAILIAIGISGLFSGILLVLKRAERKTKIAFAPFITIGTFVAAFSQLGVMT